MAQTVKNHLQWGRPGFHPWLGRSPGGRHSKPLQYSCLENPKGRGAWLVGYSPRGRKEWDMIGWQNNKYTRLLYTSTILSLHVPLLRIPLFLLPWSPLWMGDSLRLRLWPLETDSLDWNPPLTCRKSSGMSFNFLGLGFQVCIWEDL